MGSTVVDRLHGAWVAARREFDSRAYAPDEEGRAAPKVFASLLAAIDATRARWEQAQERIAERRREVLRTGHPAPVRRPGALSVQVPLYSPEFLAQLAALEVTPEVQTVAELESLRVLRSRYALLEAQEAQLRTLVTERKAQVLAAARAREECQESGDLGRLPKLRETLSAANQAHAAAREDLDFTTTALEAVTLNLAAEEVMAGRLLGLACIREGLAKLAEASELRRRETQLREAANLLLLRSYGHAGAEEMQPYVSGIPVFPTASGRVPDPAVYRQQLRDLPKG